jgi:hypothetical protein
VVGQFEIRSMLAPLMKAILEGLSLGSGALLIAVLSVGVVWLLSSLLPKGLRWLWVVIVPFIFAYCLYWSPVWLGSDPSEYSAWAVLIVAVWFLAGAVPSVVMVLIIRKRRST